MRMIGVINEAIDELTFLGVRRQDMRIAFSKIVERLLAEEIAAEGYFLFPNFVGGLVTKLEGIVCNNEFPYNKIVVYSIDCIYNEKLRIEIEFENHKT